MILATLFRSYIHYYEIQRRNVFEENWYAHILTTGTIPSVPLTIHIPTEQGIKATS